MRGKLSCTFIVIFITIKSVICYTAIPTEAIFHCIENNQADNECTSKNAHILRTEVNETEGSAIVEFDYASSCSYNLTVDEVSYDMNKEECENFKHKYLPFPSVTLYTYEYSGESDKHDEDLPICTKKGAITLKYLKKGCYYLTLQNKWKPYYNDRKPLYLAGPEIVKFSDYNLTFKINDNSGENTKTSLLIKHPYINLNTNLNINVQFVNRTVVADWDFVSINSELKTNESKLSPYLPIIDCEKDESQIICNIEGLDNGSYIFRYTLSNLLISCHFWRGCRGQSEIHSIQNIRLPRPGILQSSSNFLTWIIWGVTFLGIVLIVIFCIYLKKTNGGIYNDKFKNFFQSHTDSQTLIEHRKVLLLYPRDADIVMKTMEAFRKALTAEEFEVYDVFDEDQQKKINQDMNKWISEKISEKDMKIILVRTYCGHILATNSNANYVYQHATCYDSVFPYALSCIRERRILIESKKLVIVTMGFEKIKYTDLILDSSAKFAVPDNFKQLIQTLLEINPEKCAIDICLSNNKFNEFKNMFNEMKKCIENVEYIEEITNASIRYNNEEPQQPLEPKIILL